MSETPVPYLVPETDNRARRAVPLTVPLAQVHLSPRNTRKIIAQEELQELATSMGQHGQLTRCLVRPMPCPEGHDPSVPHYELAAGHRRTLAALLLGWSHIDVDVREMDDHAFLMALWTENLQRADVPPLEEARGLQDLLDAGWDVRAIAQEIGRPEQFVRGRLQLLKAADEVQEAMLRGLVPVTHAMELAKLTHEYQREALAAIFALDVRALADAALARAEERDWDEELSDDRDEAGQGGESFGMVHNPFAKPYQIPRSPSLADLRAELRQRFYRRLAVVAWDVSDDTLVPGAGSCAACEKRSGHTPSLFPELSDTTGDVCLDGACFAVKTKAHEKRVKAAERKAARAQQAEESDVESGEGPSATPTPTKAQADELAEREREAQRARQKRDIVQAGRSAALRELASAVTGESNQIVGLLRAFLCALLEVGMGRWEKDDMELMRIMHGSSYDSIERGWDWQSDELTTWILDEERTAVQLLRLVVLLTCHVREEVEVTAWDAKNRKQLVPKTTAALAELLAVDVLQTVKRVERETAERIKAEEKAAAAEAKKAARAKQKAAARADESDSHTPKAKRRRRPAGERDGAAPTAASTAA